MEKEKEILDHGLVLPLTFRLYQTIRFNRPVDRETDHISPGGYELVMRDKDGTEKSIQFDFDDSEGSIDDKDPCLATFMQKNPSYDEFPEIRTITEHMLRNVVRVEDWFIYTGEPGESDPPLIPVEIVDAQFTIINDATAADIPLIDIPISTPIRLTGGQEEQNEQADPQKDTETCE